MTKTILLKNIAGKLEGCSQKDVSAVLDAFEEVITDTLKADATESVPVGKLGKFKVKDVPKRTGKIMLGDRKGEEYITPAHQEITFKMNKSAKQL